MTLPIDIDPDSVRIICERYQAKKLALFGSVLTDRFGPESDIDFVVEFSPEARPTFIDLMRMQADLSDLLGRAVDLRTPNELSKHFKDQVMQSALVQYAA